MNDLYSLSQLIKSHPLYSLHRDEIHRIYFLLGQAGVLHADRVLAQLKEELPELFLSLQKNHELFKRHCLESHRLLEKGIHLICYGEDLYPRSCYLMSEPPLTLSYSGEPAWKVLRSISVVGSREPRFESIQWMEKEFALFCENENPCVVSGGARGIDQKSHAIALRKKCPTVVVLPSGLGEIYPDSLQEWIRPVIEQGGCFLSEYSYEQRMHKHLFHHRNRLIAALGGATLLIEARRRSGTMITAQQATQLGRPVWVVPGHPQDSHFAGSLDLLAEGAMIVRDAQDLSIYLTSEFGGKTPLSIGVVEPINC